MLSTLHVLGTNVSNLQKQISMYNDKKSKENKELKQLIEDQEKKIQIAGDNLELEVKERKENQDSVSEQLKFIKKNWDEHEETVANLGKKLEDLRYFQQHLILEIDRIETITKENKEEKETSKKQIQLLYRQIDDYFIKNKEIIDALATKSEHLDETLLDVQKDVESLKVESGIFF